MKYYNQYLPYVVFSNTAIFPDEEYDGKSYVRRLYDDDKENKSGIITFRKRKVKVEYYM